MIKDYSSFYSSETQLLLGTRALKPFQIISGIQTYIDYLHQNLCFFPPTGRINFGMGDVAGLTQCVNNYATMLNIPKTPPTPPFNPNYPPFSGASSISGLLGWYDSSTANSSSILNSSGSTATNGQTISSWVNLFNGATQGSYVLPNFIVSGSGSGTPTLNTSVQYKYNTSTYTNYGNPQRGINFHGGRPWMQLSSNLPVNTYKYLTWFVAAQTIYETTQYGDPVFGLVDQIGYQTGICVTQYVGDATAFGGNLGNNSAGDVSIGKYPSSIIATASIPSLGVSFYGSTDPVSGIITGNNQGFGGNESSTAYTFQNYWGNITLGKDYVTPELASNSIGEVLVYAGSLTVSQRSTISQYLYNKWNN